MDKFPSIGVTFVITGKHIDFEELSKEIDIVPTEVRGIDDWPEIIKNNLDLPEELRPRCAWKIKHKVDFCRQVEIPIHKIIEQLKGKEQKLLEYCEKNALSKTLVIVIYAEAMNLPEIVLRSNIVSYFGSLGVEIGFDPYIY